MKSIFKYSMMFAAALALSASLSSCSDSDDDNNDGKDKTDGKVTVTGSDATVAEAGNNWKAARQDWEWSEAFLFGPAGDFSIDPHIDTWPFANVQFDKYMAKYNPISDSGDAEILTEAITTGQNLTGFHAVEYLIFRNGESRKIADMTANEVWFAQTAAQDLYLASLKLVSAWGGSVTTAEQKMLDDAEFESKDYGQDFIKAGQAGSSYSSVALATRQIIAGAKDIIGEVRDSKIGAPATGEDINYIESPHSYNSIVDFYDNIMSCKHTLYGGWTVTGNPTSSSLIGVCQRVEGLKTLANTVTEKMTNALEKVNAMKKPFVLYYSDQSAHDAMSALSELDDALSALDEAIEPYGTQLDSYFKTVNEDFVNKSVIPTYRALADNAKKMVESLNKLGWTK
jgi:hypothetical protein